MARKKAENNGWVIAEDGKSAEKTASFGGNPLKSHYVYGENDDVLRANIEDFDNRLGDVNEDDDGE